MPVVFAGHGSPMNAIEDNLYSRTWRIMAELMPRPEVIFVFCKPKIPTFAK
jgi:4,5-DOPA dioxygenase extradiol